MTETVNSQKVSRKQTIRAEISYCYDLRQEHHKLTNWGHLPVVVFCHWLEEYKAMIISFLVSLVFTCGYALVYSNGNTAAILSIMLISSTIFLLMILLLAYLKNRQACREIAKGESGELVFFHYSQKLLGEVLAQNKRLEGLIAEAKLIAETQRAEEEQRKREELRQRIADALRLEPKFDVLIDIIEHELGGVVSYTYIEEDEHSRVLVAISVKMSKPNLLDDDERRYDFNDDDLEKLTGAVARLRVVVREYDSLHKLLEAAV